MENSIAISQDEVDKLFGIISQDAKTKSSAEEKKYKRPNFFKADEIEIVKKQCSELNLDFEKALKDKFGAPKIRKLILTNAEEITAEEFFDSLTKNDFLYRLSLNGANLFIKLDSFLYGALSGLVIDPMHKINFFQTEVLRHFVIAILAKCIEKKYGLNEGEIKVENMFEKSPAQYSNKQSGIAMSINWNENLRSFGIEKLFETREFMREIKNTKKNNN